MHVTYMLDTSKGVTLPLSTSDLEFLASYDASAFERPSVAVDVVVLTQQARDGEIGVLVYPRLESPFTGQFSLPGGFVGIREPLEAAVERVLLRKAGLKELAVEQLRAFGTPDRDPRLRVISVAWLALAPEAALHGVGEGARVVAVAGALAGGGLAFDHAEILQSGLDHLGRNLDLLAYRLLPPRFTLRELQGVHEAVLGQPLNKDSFRRRQLALGNLRPTGSQQSGVEHRPAALYTFQTQT